MDISLLVQAMPELMRSMPFFINLMQLIFLAVFTLTTGGYIMKAYKGFMPGYMRVAGRISLGFIATICGVALSGFFPYFSGDIVFRMAQSLFINAILGIIVATVVMYSALRMISYHMYNIPGIEKAIADLERLSKKAKDIKRREHSTGRHGIRHPVRLAGIIMMAVFIIILLPGFKGLPDPLEEIGISYESLNNMADQMEQLNEAYGDRISEIASDPGKAEACMGALEILQNQSVINDVRPYSNPQVKRMISEYTGEDVSGMYSIPSGDRLFIFSVTQTKRCISTLDTVCLCHETGNIL